MYQRGNRSLYVSQTEQGSITRVKSMEGCIKTDQRWDWSGVKSDRLNPQKGQTKDCPKDEYDCYYNRHLKTRDEGWFSKGRPTLR